MNFRAPVDGSLFLRFGEPEHGGQWSKAETSDIGAQKKSLVDVHEDGFGARQHEAVGSHNRWAFEQGIDRKRIATFCFLDVELREVRKFLCLARGGDIERDGTCREPILAQFP